MFPRVELLNNHWEICRKRLLLMAHGFEQRTFSFLESECDAIFSDAVVYEYSTSPHDKAENDRLVGILKSKMQNGGNIDYLQFNRFVPSEFEFRLRQLMTSITNNYQEIVIDISVMSKLLIMITVWMLKEFRGTIKIVYSEPHEYWPSKADFEKKQSDFGDSLEDLVSLPSFGVHDVVRTPELTSVIMQQCPNIVIAFTSFNELLIRALMSSISPMHFFLISSVPPRLGWREDATLKLHEKLLEDFIADNPRNSNSKLVRRCSTLQYSETFNMLAEIYAKYCYEYRIILAPTGSKMQALGCALIKCCCPDVHIEYPTPESYFKKKFSSLRQEAIHQVCFEHFSDFLDMTSKGSHLNG